MLLAAILPPPQEYHPPEDGANTDEDRAERQREALVCHLDTWMQPCLKLPYPALLSVMS